MTSLRHAWRSLAKSPGFVAVAIGALALGLGLSTTMFAVLDAIVHPYVPYRDPEHLYNVAFWFQRTRGTLTPRDMYDAVAHTQSLQVTPVVFDGQLPLESDEDSRTVIGMRISPDFFALTGIRVWAGRPFTAGDGEDVIILAEDLWRRLHGNTKTLGNTTVRVGPTTYRVIGVMPRGSGFADVFLPQRGDLTGFPAPMARIRPGFTKAQADDELRALGRRLTEQYASRDRAIAFELKPVTARREEIKDIHKAMVGSALLVLIIACVNLANLMLARGLSKRRELALRLALGGRRRTIVGQMFLECVLVATAGAILGALGAVWGSNIINNRMPEEISWVGLMHPQLSWRVFALAGLAALVSSIAIGLLPAIRVVTQVSLDEPLKDGAGTTARARQRYSGLVIIEVALALVLMMGAGLLLRTVQQLKGAEYSFNASTLLTGNVGFRMNPKDSASALRRDAVMAAIGAIPGVKSVAWSTQRAPRGGALTAEMVGGDSVRTISAQRYSVVSWQYLSVHGLTILQGRDFQAGDAGGNGKAVINPVAAQHLYPGQDPTGHMIKLGAPDRDAPWIPIVGVFRSPVVLRGSDLRPTPPMVIVAGGDYPLGWGSFLVRTQRRSASTALAVKRAIHALPAIWFSNAEWYDYGDQAELRSQIFLAKVFGTMGAVALALAALGLYAVLAYAVNQRMREFAVRIALGAESRQIFRMVLHDGFVMLLAGIGVGAFIALLAARMLDAVLAGVLPSDVVSLVGCEIVLIAAGMAAALSPARRAVRANPLDILRAV